MDVRETMTPTADLVDPITTIRNAAQRMRDDDVGALPVGENDRLVGMVTDRDITVRGVADEKAPGNCTVREVISEGAVLLLRGRRQYTRGRGHGRAQGPPSSGAER